MFHLLNIVIFHSYVGLPEATTILRMDCCTKSPRATDFVWICWLIIGFPTNGHVEDIPWTNIYIYISYDLPINIPIKWLVNVGHVCVFIFHGGSRWITHVYQFLNSKWSGNHCFWWLNMVKHRSQMSKSPVRQDTAASSQVLPVCTPEPGNSVCVVGSPLYSNIIP